MTATLISTAATGSPEWHAARRGKITGSRIAAVMGVSPFESRFSLWHRMRGDIGEPALNAAMEWGPRLESAVLRKWEDEHGRDDILNTSQGVYVHDERPWQAATPDGIAFSGLVEAKTSRYGDDYGTPGTDEIPVHVRAQVLWYCDVLDLDAAWVAVLIAGSDYREYRIVVGESERRDIEAMRSAAFQFLADLDNDVRPDIDAHGETATTIRVLHPDIEPGSIDVPDDIARPLIASKHALDTATSEHLRARNLLADYMDCCKSAWWSGVKIADRRARNGGLPYVQLVKTLPDLETTP